MVNSNYTQDYCKASGAHVRKLREKKGIGMRQFALEVDIEYSQLSKIKRGVTIQFIFSEALTVIHSLLF